MFCFVFESKTETKIRPKIQKKNKDDAEKTPPSYIQVRSRNLWRLVLSVEWGVGTERQPVLSKSRERRKEDIYLWLT